MTAVQPASVQQVATTYANANLRSGTGEKAIVGGADLSTEYPPFMKYSDQVLITLSGQ